MKRTFIGLFTLLVVLVFGITYAENSNADRVKVEADSSYELKLNKEIDTVEDNSSNILSKPEYSSFEGYIESEITQEKFDEQKSIYQEDDFKNHRIRVANSYLKHFKALDEVPESVADLVDEAIEITEESFQNNKSEKEYFEEIEDIQEEIHMLIDK
ncbi:hypothetical protein [Paraliobacillus zengyii]|uniref:hypothetical protein n=1 Tax=Paraliobacillus zengyii TaxID=2213194 RepID=UPI000DD347E2|nr:hypothetical protein [Paraliobacillus zengyii]